MANLAEWPGRGLSEGGPDGPVRHRRSKERHDAVPDRAATSEPRRSLRVNRGMDDMSKFLRDDTGTSAIDSAALSAGTLALAFAVLSEVYVAIGGIN